MKAAILTGVDQPLELMDLEAAPLGVHDARVRIEATGLCHSDLSVIEGSIPYPPPIILGHEGAGVVTEVGAAVTRVRVGDRVIASFTPTCGRCAPCLRDEAHLCSDYGAFMQTKGVLPDGRKVRGMSGLGTFSDEVGLHQDSLVAVHADLPMEQLALIGCGATTGLGASLNTAGIKAGETVAIIGCGGVGLFALMGSVLAGASRVIGVDLDQSKLDAAATLGATDLVNARDADTAEQIKALTAGAGVDHCLEVVGNPSTMKDAIDATRRGGTTTFVGMPRMDSEITLSAYTFFYEAKTIKGCFYGSAQVRRDFQRWIDLAECGRLDLSAVISHRYSLPEINSAVNDLKAGNVLRAVIV